MQRFFTIRWRAGRVVMLDQRRLPTQEIYRTYRDHRAVARAIKDMVVRGAPAIGVAAAMGIALAARQLKRIERPEVFAGVCRRFAATRPTAVNLFWAIQRMRKAYEASREKGGGRARVARALLAEALSIYKEDVAANRRMGRYGAALIPKGATVLTHCNAGALATAGYGTALGIVRAAWSAGRVKRVLVPETRPFLQGSRLTAWELARDGIPVTLITDSMVGHFMQRGEIDCVVVGADRAAANGDVANKIGTYTTAVLAARHGVPFYVAAPTSTIDLACPDGRSIPIEERPAREVTHIANRRIAPPGVAVANPAFDVTPHELVTAVVTERGVARPPLARSLARLGSGEEAPAGPKRRRRRGGSPRPGGPKRQASRAGA